MEACINLAFLQNYPSRRLQPQNVTIIKFRNTVAVTKMLI